MKQASIMAYAESRAGALRRARVLSEQPNGTLVSSDATGGSTLLCDVLRTSKRDRLVFSPGDEVLVALPEGAEERGVILGLVEQPRGASGFEAALADSLEGTTAPASPDPVPEEDPDELVLVAKKNLTIRCGESSVTLRADGKILIKGVDLVSRAQRMNRIKGGAVAIN